jgi:predicted transcriptional regulator
MSPFLFRGYKSIQEVLTDCLGQLERDVMGVIWAGGEMTVRTVCAHLDSTTAYTTVMTTMDRLFKKGLLGRTKVGRAFVYQAIITKDELDSALAADVVRSILQRDEQAPLQLLSLLVDTVSALDLSLLDDLERLIREKRQRSDHAKPD